MDAAARRRVLYLVGVLLMTFDLLTFVHSQGACDVWLSLRNTTYQNNSIVLLEDIGDGDDALLCITNQTACCQPPYPGVNGSVLGNWFFPNGSRVSGLSNQLDFHTTRGQMVVRMNRRRGGVEGIYRCEIPDTVNLIQTIYTGVYSASTAAVLRGIPYQNNSIVILENIGKGDDALLCITFQTACCRPPYTGEMGLALGNWFFPNGTGVSGSSNQSDFYRTRGQMVVRMNRRRGGVEGIYRCVIPDSMNVTQTIYIGVYSASTAAVLRGIPYMNNSNVTLEDIGEGDDALLCKTNLTACCQPPYTGEMGHTLGNWFFPNRKRVPCAGLGSDIYRTRGQMVVRMNRRRGGVEGIYHCVIPDAMNVNQTIYIGVYSASTVSTLEATTTVCNSNIQPTNTPQCGRTNTTVGISSIQPTSTLYGDGATTTIISSNIQPTNTLYGDGATTAIISSIQPTSTLYGDGATTAIISSNIQPTNTLYGDGATTIPVIIVVSVVIILLIIIVGVIILVILFKKKKKQLKSNQPRGRNELKQKEKKASLGDDQQLYAVVDKETPPSVPEKSEELVEYLDRTSTFTGEVPAKLIPARNEYAFPASPSRLVNLSHSMVREMESNPTYKSMDQQDDIPYYTNVPQGTASDDIYTTPEVASSQAVGADDGIFEAVYSEPIQPSLFTDTVGSPSDSDDLQPYGPIYTVPAALTKSEEMPLKVLGDNIREIHELGIGVFGQVILAETVGLSPKDLKMSKTDDDKSKSTLVAVKTLKSGAPSTTKEAFEKEVNFMSRLNDRNVIRILGVCYEDTPFIMMEYMEKGDLNRYLRKFKELSTTDSEPQGQITTSTLVHITTQIASAMKYLASHNYVHRDLATRNCLVGPNYLVKISDFGMSRSLYESHYYRIQGHAVLPVRWMSMECFYGKFSQKSDVWAFGITTWEIFTLAKEQPYNGMSDKQVIDNAIKGKNRKLLAKPDMCPPEVYDIMLKCWVHRPSQRATFEQLFQLLSSIRSH